MYDDGPNLEHEVVRQVAQCDVVLTKRALVVASLEARVAALTPHICRLHALFEGHVRARHPAHRSVIALRVSAAE